MCSRSSFTGRCALACALLLSCATWTSTGRLVNAPCLHVGGRVHSDDLGHDYALTVQVSTEWAPCRVVYPSRADADAGLEVDLRDGGR
jgi:hypothetical protein